MDKPPAVFQNYIPILAWNQLLLHYYRKYLGAFFAEPPAVEANLAAVKRPSPSGQEKSGRRPRKKPGFAGLRAIALRPHLPWK
jgi:hypothetical protein